jgi:hypothetical protein
MMLLMVMLAGVGRCTCRGEFTVVMSDLGPLVLLTKVGPVKVSCFVLYKGEKSPHHGVGVVHRTT